MLSNETSEQLAKDWIDSWNAHDIDRIMEHYSQDIEFSSPLIVKILGDPEGKIRGKESLRAYFLKGLAAYPDLHFELYHVLSGCNSLVIYYHSVKDLIGTEVMILDGNHKIKNCLCHYKSTGE